MPMINAADASALRKLDIAPNHGKVNKTLLEQTVKAWTTIVDEAVESAIVADTNQVSFRLEIGEVEGKDGKRDLFTAAAAVKQVLQDIKTAEFEDVKLERGNYQDRIWVNVSMTFPE